LRSLLRLRWSCEGFGGGWRCCSHLLRSLLHRRRRRYEFCVATSLRKGGPLRHLCGGGVAFPTSVGQLTVVDLSSSPIFLKMAADVLSSSTMCFGLGAGSRLLWQQNFTPLRRIGGGPCLAVSRLLRRTEGRWRGAPAALGSVWWLGIAACNFLFL